MNLPIMFGMNPPTKKGIGVKSKISPGYDLYILDEDMKRQYTWLHFCNKDAIDRLIGLLQKIKELWEQTEQTTQRPEWKDRMLHTFLGGHHD